MSEIEELWKVLVKEQFSSREHRDRMWGLCQKGMPLVWKWRTVELHQIPSFAPPKDFPCYTRAVTSLEREGRFDQAIMLRDQALRWIESAEWYARKKDDLLKRIAKQEGRAKA